MKRTITTSLSLLTVIALLGMSTSANAEELKIVDEGKLVKENIDLQKSNIQWWKTADGYFVYRGSDATRGTGLYARQAAVGDCECKYTFSFVGALGRGGILAENFTLVHVHDR